MDFIDYYKILGINKNATEDEIKKAYRKLARKFHPDLHPNDDDAKMNFQKINEANNVLSDPNKRKKYDHYGKDWQHADEFEKAKQNQSSAHRRNNPPHSSGDFSDFFDAMFGGSSSGGNHRTFKGDDYRTSLELSLLDAYKTHHQTLTVNGKAVRIKISAGIENGQTVRLRGLGGAGINGGLKGDLYITFSVAEHPKFKRLENDLYLTVQLDLYTAVLGGEITIDTLNGKVKLQVKPETENGEKIRLKGKGFPIYKKENEFGDLYVSYQIKIPTGLNDRQKHLFKELSLI